MSARQGTMFGEAPQSAPKASSDYRITKCVCGTRVVVGRNVVAVACPVCRQVVSGLLLGGES